ncbi:MAG: protein kinase [Gemmatimonadaceae bacterium]|nr:protein kinase [Gemmatimonadaceae bacterium]
MRSTEALAAALGERYVLHESIGQGGMAVVYRATDRRHARDVAVKVLKDDDTSPHAADRFRREIELAARLTHPHILPVHDSGAHEQLRWYVMPLIRGASLRARLDDGALATHEALRIAQEVAEALAFAHAHAVVHRDVKPENILLEEGHAVLGDFGVARLVDGIRKSSWTKTGHVVGTPAYMSPEQGTGEHEVTGASDVYALGCVLYEMLAGAPPFGRGPHALVLLRHVNDPPPSLLQRTGIPAGIDALVQRMLDKNPLRRPTAADAAHELDDLRAFSRSGSVAVAPARPRPVAARRSWAMAAFGATLAVAATIVGVETWRSRRAAAETVEPMAVDLAAVDAPSRGWVVVGDFDAGTADTALARAVRELVRASLEESRVARGLSALDMRRVARAAGWPDTARITPVRAVEAAKRYGVPAAITGTVGNLGPAISISLDVLASSDGRSLVTLAERGPRDSIVSLVDRLGRRLQQAVGARAEELRGARPLYDVATPALDAFDEYVRGVELSRAGRIEEGTALLRRAVARDTAFAAAWAALATNYGNLGVRDSTVAMLQRARAFPQRLTDLQRLRLDAEVALKVDADPARAVRIYDEVLAVDSTALSARNNRGNARLYLGDYAGALDDFAAAWRFNPIRKETGWTALFNQVIALAALGRPDSIAALRPRFTAEQQPFALIGEALARRDGALVRRVADELAESGRVSPTQLYVGPLVTAARAGGACAMGELTRADSILARAAADTGYSRTLRRWFVQQRLVLDAIAPQARTRLAVTIDTTLAVHRFASTLLGSDARVNAVQGDAVAALAGADRRRAGLAPALAAAARVAPSLTPTAYADTLVAIARRGDPTDDTGGDRPIDAVAVAAAVQQLRVIGDSARARTLLREVALRPRTAVTQLPMHLCLRALAQ